MTLQRFLTGAAMAVAAICFGAALVAADRDASRAFLEVTGFDIAITSMQAGAIEGPAIAGEDPDAFGIAWVSLAREVFAPEGLIEDTLDMMEAILPEALLEHGMAFYGSPLGQRLVVAENAAQGVSGARQMAEGEVIVTGLADSNPARIDEFRRMSDAIGGVETTARAVIEVQLRYLLAAIDAGVSDVRFSEAELREILSRNAPRLKEAIALNSVFASAYVYRDFSDDDLRAYRAALEAPEMRQIYEILNGIQYEIMGQRYEVLAAKLAALSPQTDI